MNNVLRNYSAVARVTNQVRHRGPRSMRRRSTARFVPALSHLAEDGLTLGGAEAAPAADLGSGAMTAWPSRPTQRSSST